MICIYFNIIVNYSTTSLLFKKRCLLSVFALTCVNSNASVIEIDRVTETCKSCTCCLSLLSDNSLIFYMKFLVSENGTCIIVVN